MTDDGAVDKVVAYVVRGSELLVFVHADDTDPLLESGLQVPAGTVQDGEPSEDAVLREGREETGLTDLRIVRPLGADIVRWPADAFHPRQRRHFFELTTDDFRRGWTHVERHAEDGIDHPFRFFWIPVGSAALLGAGQGLMAWKLAAE